MTNEHCLRWAISKHLRDRGSRLDMKGVKLGNAVIDGEVVGNQWRMALEIKSQSFERVKLKPVRVHSGLYASAGK